MKQQIFGLRKAQVDRLVKQLEMEFISAETQLKLELERLMTENRQLQMELEKRIELIPKDNDDLKVWSFAESRIEEVIQYLEEKKSLELEEIRRRHVETTCHFNKQMEELDEEIQSVEKTFSDLVDHFIHEIENPSAKRPITEKNEKPAHPFILAMESKHALSSEEAAASIESLVPVQDTPISVSEEEKLDEKLPVQSDTNADQSDSFWGDIGSFANYEYTALNEKHLSTNTEYDQIDEYFNKKSMVENEPFSPAQRITVVTGSEPKGFDKQELSNDTMERPDSALLEQIDSIKNQYIVGKVAGEDLVDLHGNVILSKNSVITREAVESANQIGKLAELIINMKLAGPEEG